MLNNCEIVMEPFSTIDYTPAWYYRHFPGFYNVECYNILADNGGVDKTKNSKECEHLLTSEENNDKSG